MKEGLETCWPTFDSIAGADAFGAAATAFGMQLCSSSPQTFFTCLCMFDVINDDAGASCRPCDIEALHIVHSTATVSTELSLKNCQTSLLCVIMFCCTVQINA